MMSEDSIRQRKVNPSEKSRRDSLTVSDLVKELCNVKHKWYEIGKALNIPEAELESLAGDDKVKLRLVIEQVEPKGEQISDVKLNKITQALCDEIVNENREADKLERLVKKTGKIKVN